MAKGNDKKVTDKKGTKKETKTADTSGGSSMQERSLPKTEAGVQIPPSAHISELFERINQLIKPSQLAWVNPKTDCQLLERNARYMSKDQLNRLAENVKGDGFLSQVPFAVKIAETGKYKIVSGNHRVKAAIKANLEGIVILYLEEKDVSHEKEAAIQLSHNAIVGQDDQNILIELYKELDSLTMKEYTGIDEGKLFAFDLADLAPISEQALQLTEVRFMFSDLNLKRMDEILAKLEERLFSDKNDRIVMMDFDVFVDVMTQIKRKTNIKNNTAAFMKMLEICEIYLKQE